MLRRSSSIELSRQSLSRTCSIDNAQLLSVGLAAAAAAGRAVCVDEEIFAATMHIFTEGFLVGVYLFSCWVLMSGVGCGAWDAACACLLFGNSSHVLFSSSACHQLTNRYCQTNTLTFLLACSFHLATYLPTNPKKPYTRHSNRA